MNPSPVVRNRHSVFHRPPRWILSDWACRIKIFAQVTQWFSFMNPLDTRIFFNPLAWQIWRCHTCTRKRQWVLHRYKQPICSHSQLLLPSLSMASDRYLLYFSGFPGISPNSGNSGRRRYILQLRLKTMRGWKIMIQRFFSMGSTWTEQGFHKRWNIVFHLLRYGYGKDFPVLLSTCSYSDISGIWLPWQSERNKEIHGNISPGQQPAQKMH